MMRTGILHRMRQRMFGDRAGERGSAMLLVLMAIMIVSSLSILLLGTLIAQTKPIPLQRKTEMTVNAAQAGFDAVLSQIRAATKVIAGVNATGDATKLPCYWTSGFTTTTGPTALTGTVAGTNGTAKYKVYVTYYQDDPSNQLQVWRNDPTNQIGCDVNGAYKTPSFALLVSTGSDGSGNPSGNRTLTTTYKFSTDNTNMAGGPIHLAGVTPAAQAICWDAGSTIPTLANPTPPSPWNLTLNTCYSGAPQQGFQYRRNYSIVLGVTTTTDTDGYCLTAPATAGNPVTLTKCDPNNTAGLLARQQWGVDAADRYYVTMGGSNYTIDGRLSGASSQSVGAVLILVTQGSGRTWTANSSVGPGNGGAPIGEMANYSLFGNCFDVTHWNPGEVAMILYPCKQPTPDSGDKPDANQVVKYDSVNKWLYVDTTVWNGNSWTGKGKYCFVAPTAAGGYVLPSPCSTTAANQKWIQGDMSRYTTAFTFTSVTSGQCLASGPFYSWSSSDTWPTVVTAPCSGDATQKWNATNNPVPSGQDNTVESADGQ